MSITGTCNCGAVNVTIPEMPSSDKTVMCYCMGCRKAGGGVGSLNYVSKFDEIIFEDNASSIEIYEDKNTASGAIATRRFCGDCGSPICTTTPNAPGLAYLKVSLFDTLTSPGGELFEERKPGWFGAGK